MGLRTFLRDWNEFAAMTEFGIVIGYFAKLELDSENFVGRGERGEFWTQKFFVQEAKGRK